MQKIALITGIAGQDGSYLAELLLDKGYIVHGIVRNLDSSALFRVNKILKKINLHKCDVTVFSDLKKIIDLIGPDEIYHLAALVETRNIPELEEEIWSTNFVSSQNILKIVRDLEKKMKVFFAGSSTIFGVTDLLKQNELTPINPTNFYGIAKSGTFLLAKLYRENYGLFCVTGILFNHESPRRDFKFLPRKITSAAAKIKLGLQKDLVLGDVEVRRDWGFAGDYAEAMWLMLQAPKPEDYVIGSGEQHSIRDVLEEAFGYLDLDWKNFVKIDETFIRKDDKSASFADISKIVQNLNWRPKTSFIQLIRMMVDEDLRINKK
jgi:GDPmannose 4,6-dehydratase